MRARRDDDADQVRPGEMHMAWQDAQNPVNVAAGTLTRLGG
ncbi:MAG: hypothetical protein ACRDPO_02745 [Streptosporangiaceae bacterium]